MPRCRHPLFADLEVEHEATAIFADYWASLPRPDLVPARADFDPVAVPAILPTFVIHELHAPSDIRIRLAGTEIREHYGVEITGLNYLDFVAPERQATASRAIFLVCEQPCGMLVRLSSRTAAGSVMVNESLALPMRDDDGRIRLVYYQSNSRPMLNRDPGEDPLLRHELVGRHFLDIGAGVPDYRDESDLLQRL